MLETFRKYFAFGGSLAPYLRRGMAWQVLGSFFEAWQIMALAVVLTALAGDGVTAGTAVSAGAVMLGSIVGTFVTAHFKSENFCYGNYSMVGEKRERIGDRLRYLPMGYFNENNLGAVTGTMTNTLEDIQNTGGLVYTNVLTGLVFSLVAAVMMVFLEWRVGLLVAATMAVVLAVTAWMQRSARRVSGRRVAAQSAIVGAVLEYLEGMGVVRAFSLTGAAARRLDAAIDECERVNVELELSVLRFAMLQTVVTKAASIAICLGSVAWWLDGSMEPGVCLTMIAASFMVFAKMEQASLFSSILRQIDLSMDKVNAMLETPVMGEGAGAERPASHDIRLEDVSFSYDGKDAGRAVVDHVSLEVPERTTLALVGPSGSGKTTISQLMARFWDVDEGRVTLGGTDVRDFRVDSLLASFSIVFQGVYLFDDTVEANIAFGRPGATHEEVVEAARRACCHEFIERLPNGYATRIGEGGARLSGGERQRVSIARAILKDAPIVILDEATANVDPENETELMRAIEELCREKTVVMIAHRLRTVRNADRIAVIDRGRVAQLGTHEELVREGGIYRDFVTARERAAGWRL